MAIKHDHEQSLCILSNPSLGEGHVLCRNAAYANPEKANSENRNKHFRSAVELNNELSEGQRCISRRHHFNYKMTKETRYSIHFHSKSENVFSAYI